MADRRRPDAEETDPEESFVARWSRRKRESGRERDAAAPAREPEPPAAEEAPAAAETGPTDADLPPPDALGPDSDYSAYLSGRVSEELRRAALRKLFRLPQFNVRDGLDDYDEDYRSFAALGDTVTADMRYHEERLREKERRRREQEARETAEQDPDAVEPSEAETARAATDESVEHDDATDPGEPDDPDAGERHV